MPTYDHARTPAARPYDGDVIPICGGCGMDHDACICGRCPECHGAGRVPKTQLDADYYEMGTSTYKICPVCGSLGL